MALLIHRQPLKNALSPCLLSLCCAGGHIVHLGSTLGQLDALPLVEFKQRIRDATTIQQLMDLQYPADEIAKVNSEIPSDAAARVLTFEEHA